MPRILPFILMVISACQVQTEPSFKLPADVSTEAEKEKIHAIISTIEADLDQLGVTKKLDTIPIIVAKLEDRVAARCYKDERDRAIGIVVAASTLADVGADPRYLPLSFKAILHEIGHCYFDRDHEEVAFSVPDQSIKLVLGEGEIQTSHIITLLSPTIMEPVDLFMIPVELRSYYVAEVAGKERLSSWEDLDQFGQVELVPAPVFSWGAPTPAP